MQNIYTITSILNIILSLSMLFGGVFAYRKAVTKAHMDIQDQSSEAQARTIEAMQGELEIVKGRTDELKYENKRLNHIIQTICEALKLKGIAICINGEIVNIRTKDDTTTARIQESSI
jgi:hypothetical protein